MPVISRITLRSEADQPSDESIGSCFEMHSHAETMTMKLSGIAIRSANTEKNRPKTRTYIGVRPQYSFRGRAYSSTGGGPSGGSGSGGRYSIRCHYAHNIHDIEIGYNYNRLIVGCRGGFEILLIPKPVSEVRRRAGFFGVRSGSSGVPSVPGLG
jgi:hypothetical protein